MTAPFGTPFKRTRPSDTPEKSPSLPASVPPPPGFDTVLGAGCALEGKLISSGNVRLDGTFSGTLDISGNILVGETAHIEADIHARNISIAGSVKGNVAGNKVQILRTGKVWGDITVTALATEEGAFIEGKITMIRHDSAKESAPPVIVEETGPAETADPGGETGASND